MAASMWRMNGLWRRMAGVLLLCVLLLSSEIMCQDATDAPAADADAATDAAADPAAATDASGAADSAATAAAPADDDQSAASAAPADGSNPATSAPDSQDGDTSGTAGPTDAAAPAGDAEVPIVPEVLTVLQMVVPEVNCVGEKEIDQSIAVKAEVSTADCDETKSVIEGNPAGWCSQDKCKIDIFQDGKTLLVASKDAKSSILADALKSDSLKEKLGVTKADVPAGSSGSSVFVGILVSGLLAAIGIIIGYFKCQRRTDTKAVKLADEAFPVDQENQGNTLVSVAPLNPPPETPEKPAVNGESPEADKTQPPPPTNGHSATKTADTEL